MKKLMNSPAKFVDETMEGIFAAYGDRIAPLNGDLREVVCRGHLTEGKVGLVTGGGSGHLPVFLGYVGEGMLDGCAVGNLFASPSARKMADVIRACDFGAGVLCLFGNYGGDGMNFELACDMVEMEDVRTRIVRVCDDAASAPPGRESSRRGVAGMVYAYKVAGAAASAMLSLEDVTAVTERALSQIRTIGVALSPCTLPQVGRPTFSISEDEIEIGMGIHGEPGIETRKLMTADELADLLLDRLLTELPLKRGDEVSVMVNGLGTTPLEEQFILYRRLSARLNGLGVNVLAPHIGEFATSMEMAGASVTLFRLDAELKRLLLAPASTPFYTNLNR